MKSLISWFAKNHVAANLLMVFIIAAGIFSLSNITQEIFPEASADTLTVSVVYRGASPEEVEESVCIRIEEEILSIDGIKEVRSQAREGVGIVTVEIRQEADNSKVLDEVKSAVDSINTFPEETEKPVVSEVVLRYQVVDVAIFGEADEWTVTRVAEQIRDDLLAIEGISQVRLAGVRPYEISIEVSEDMLRRHSLSLDQVARAVSANSIDMPGGSVKTRGGEVLVRTKGQRYWGEQFLSIPVITNPDGTTITLADVATIRDGFEDTDQIAIFDQKPAAMVQVFRVGEQDALAIADKVKQYVQQSRSRLPEGLHIETWQDFSKHLRDRLDLLVRNGRIGLALVFLSLAFFLQFRLALWVAVGIPISFMGAFWLIPYFDITINMISLFAFIIVLGMVVDDAIIVGENIYTHRQRGSKGIKASIDGALEMHRPVIVAILTTVTAFLPLINIEGPTGKIMRAVPIIVIAVLLFSLIESLLILPAHLSAIRMSSQENDGFWLTRGWSKLRGGFAKGLHWLIHEHYRKVLSFAFRWRYLTFAIFVAGLLMTFGFVAGGFIKFVYLPDAEADNVVADLTMPRGISRDKTQEILFYLEDAALRLEEDLAEYSLDGSGKIFNHIFTTMGEQPFRTRQGQAGGRVGTRFVGSHLGEVNIELAPAEMRSVSSTEIARRWQEVSGAVPDALELNFTSSIFSSGEAINIQLEGQSLSQLRSAADRLRDKIATYPGVFNITDSFREGKDELKLALKPAAQTLGLTWSDLARQVRQGFYGEEVQRVIRDREEIRVMVRYPEERRKSIGDIENMRVRTSKGGEVPFTTVADVTSGKAYSDIKRARRSRIIQVTADVDTARGNPTEIMADITANYIPQLLNEFSGVRYSLEGEQRHQQETLASLQEGFGLALLGIFALLAVMFRSYIQPVIVMSAIPFGLIGAIFGHFLMGKPLSMLSLFGVVALAGVVVNDSLILVDAINRNRKGIDSLYQPLVEAGIQRFRPILLTSLTTFLGLTPMLLERSMQAQFLIPMAISLGFGILFATFVTLLLVPCLYAIVDDIVFFTRQALGVGRKRRQLDTVTSG